MTLGRWFTLVVGGLVLAAVTGLVLAFVALDRQADRRAFLLERVIPAETLAGDIATSLLDQETSVRGFLLAQILWVLGYAALPAFFLLYAEEELGLGPGVASLWR